MRSSTHRCALKRAFSLLVKTMVFSDSSTKQGMIERVTFLTGMDTTAYATAERTREINRWYQRVVSLIFKSHGAWDFDDTDKTDFPTLTTTMVNGQEDYDLPKSLTTNATTLQGGVTAGGILKILRVEAKDANGVWVKLNQFDQADVGVALDEWQKTDGVPRFYDLRGNTVFLKPAPATGSVTMSAGLKIYIAREPYVFVAGDTTREPGFAELFHDILPLGAAHSWFVKTANFDKANSLRNEIKSLEDGLVEFYGQRNKDKTLKMNIRRVSIV